MRATPGALIPAIEFAVTKHHGQMRSGTDLPYIVHPLEVARILYEHHHTYGSLLQAAILHDVIEDTDATYDEVSDRFGEEVAEIVFDVTDDQTLTKKEQRAQLVEKIDGMMMESRLLKVADGISNVRNTNTRQPANWNRSLKLAYVKTCEKVALACKEYWTKQGMDVPEIFDTHAREVAAAKERLSKANYVEYTP